MSPFTAPLAACVDSANALPLHFKVLHITTLHHSGAWLASAIAADGAAHVDVEEVVGVTAGLARLREDLFDAVLVSHEPGVLDAIEFVEGFRAGGNDEPVIILGHEPPQELDALCYEAGADDYGCIAQTTVRGLLWRFARGIRRFQLERENRRLIQAERQRLQHEHHEAERLLEQQRAIITELEGLRDGAESDNLNELADRGGALRTAADEGFGSRPCIVGKLEIGGAEPVPPLPEPLVDHYRELLRAYVIMGAGNLAGDMAALSELLAESNTSAQRTMQLHIDVLEELVDGLGNRSARHVMNRADLLVLEVLGRLADGYRRRYCERQRPPRQLRLPGFDPSADAARSSLPVAA